MNESLFLFSMITIINEKDIIKELRVHICLLDSLDVVTMTCKNTVGILKHREQPRLVDKLRIFSMKKSQRCPGLSWKTRYPTRCTAADEGNTWSYGSV